MGEYRIQIAIARNPHTKDPDSLLKALESEMPDHERQYYERSDKLNEEQFAIFKSKLQNNPRIVVK